MSGKIFVHIGLPKTATTTLQIDFFPNFSGCNIGYLGVFQPRTEQQSDLYKSISAAVSTGLLISEARTKLKCLLDTSGYFVLSEEMFTVSDRSASWRVKLKRLNEILGELDYAILITVREPVSAMFSYYVELFDQFSTTGKCFLELAKYDERMQIYHYGKLTDAVFGCFERDRVFVKQFEEVVDGQLVDWGRLIASTELLGSGIAIRNHNTKKSSESKVYLERKVSLADLIGHILISHEWLGKGKCVIFKRLLEPVVRFMGKISFHSEVEIEKLTQAEAVELRGYLREETAALNKYFGIIYE